MSERIAESPDGVVRAMRSLATTYVGARRAGDELRTRLTAIEREHARLTAVRGRSEYGTSADRELAEVERVRRTIARSAAASDEHLRALEAVVSAVARDALTVLGRAPTQPPPLEAPVRPAADLSSVSPPVQPPAVHPLTSADAMIRGGWSPPSNDDS